MLIYLYTLAGVYCKNSPEKSRTSTLGLSTSGKALQSCSKMQSLSWKPRPLPHPKGLLLEAGAGCRQRSWGSWGVQEHPQLGLEGREGKGCPEP